MIILMGFVLATLLPFIAYYEGSRSDYISILLQNHLGNGGGFAPYLSDDQMCEIRDQLEKEQVAVKRRLIINYPFGFLCAVVIVSQSVSLMPEMLWYLTSILTVMLINVGGIVFFHNFGVIRRSIVLSHPVSKQEIAILEGLVKDKRFGQQLLQYLEGNPKASLSKIEYIMAVNRHLALHREIRHSVR
jgi:hypothetical protein